MFLSFQNKQELFSDKDGFFETKIYRNINVAVADFLTINLLVDGDVIGSKNFFIRNVNTRTNLALSLQVLVKENKLYTKKNTQTGNTLKESICPHRP